MLGSDPVVCVRVRAGELEKLVEGVKQQLRTLAITSSQEPGRIFLGFDMTRAGYVSKENLRDACIRHNLPCADDIIDCVRIIVVVNVLRTLGLYLLVGVNVVRAISVLERKCQQFYSQTLLVR